MPSSALNNFSDTFAPRLGPRLITAAATLAHYAPREAHHQTQPPEIVVQPTSIDEVQDIVRHAARFGIPLTGWGAGTSLEGNAATAQGGIAVDFSLMNKITEVSNEDMLCVIEPGVTREQLNADLRDSGLFFPVDPGANATLGGMISTRASGTTTVKYGSMRDNVLALKVVLPDGRLIKTGTRARKSAAGYDLTHLFTGSEGTLGLIVEATLRLHPRPEATLAATWDFATEQGAIDTVAMAIQCGITPARMEFLDRSAVDACNRLSSLGLPDRPMLFLEFHGSGDEAKAQLAMVEGIGRDLGGGDLRHASTEEERNKLWRARHQALPAARALRANSVSWVTDICVPISKLAEAMAHARGLIDAAGLTAPMLGHVGDGNFHVFFILDPNAPDEWTRASDVNKAMIEHAIAAGGTSTGEHGIGLGKRRALIDEHGADAVALMRAIKQAIDPDNIMNPGKIFMDGES